LLSAPLPSLYAQLQALY